jgi:outer membrane lipoprotein carrier protein
MNKLIFLFILFFYNFLTGYAQTGSSISDPVATTLLKKVSDKYKAYSALAADFKLIINRPKIKPTDDDRKFSDTISGDILLQGEKFRIKLTDQQFICDGKNIWTYISRDKEVQVNYFEESDDVFSPSKIFTLYQDGYSYQIKEKRNVGGKSIVVIEMAPVNRKVSYFKIDVTIDETNLQIIESKVYEKNGARYSYKLTKQTPNPTLDAGSFTFDAKKFPGVKVVDLR